MKPGACSGASAKRPTKSRNQNTTVGTTRTIWDYQGPRYQTRRVRDQLGGCVSPLGGCGSQQEYYPNFPQFAMDHTTAVTQPAPVPPIPPPFIPVHVRPVTPHRQKWTMCPVEVVLRSSCRWIQSLTLKIRHFSRMLLRHTFAAAAVEGCGIGIWDDGGGGSTTAGGGGKPV